MDINLVTFFRKLVLFQLNGTGAAGASCSLSAVNLKLG